MSTRVRITLDINLTSAALATALVDGKMTKLKDILRLNEGVEDVDAEAEIIYDYAPQHEHLRENTDATE